jgi:starch synthase
VRLCFRRAKDSFMIHELRDLPRAIREDGENALKIAIVAAEISPWAKAGGLADVIGALPAALRQMGAQVAVILPAYKAILAKLAATEVGGAMSVRLGDETLSFSVLCAEAPGGVPLYLIDCPRFFARDGVYGDRSGDYPDNLRRFIFFGRAAALTAAEHLQPDVIHAHDWHAAAAPIAARAEAGLRERLARTLTIFTVHNLAFQGIFDPAEYDLLGIDRSYFTIDGLEFFGRVNLMKGAVMLSDGASTVSPTYAHEVTASGELGFGLEGVLRHKGARFVGILNGADYTEWNPAHDPLIPARYTPAQPIGKRTCTRELRRAVGLPQHDERPLVGMVTRLTTQKGCDLLRDALDEVMKLDLQLVMLASGERALEEYFETAAGRHPDRLRVLAQFDNGLAHRIQAGADAFLMPSRFEPCGLTQMYALKYGAVPVVRATGGLRDTVTEFDPASSRGNGFVFEDYRPEALVGALRRMTKTYADSAAWRRLMANAFAADFSWTRAARNYIEWFERLRRESRPA